MSWSIDTTHSQVAFSIRHMMFAKVRGEFNQWSATLESDASGQLTGVKAEIQVASVDTREAQRDGHLRSADFFDVDSHPLMTFVGTPEGDQSGRFRIVGALTIRGTTRPVTLDVQFLGAGKDPWGNQRRGFHASTSVNRHDFGLNWNAALELGGVLVGDQVEIEIDVQVVGG